jgi:broad specificity phosphatase PhoE
MTSRVILISAAISAALREARFDDGCALDALGAARARSAAGMLPAADRALASPTVRCRETADALGLDALPVPELAGLAMGRWQGRTLDEVGAKEPDELATWLTDPTAAPHDGESVSRLCARVALWLETAGQTSRRTIAVVEPEIVRAAVIRTLGAPELGFWRIDVPPLTVTQFSGRSGRWNLRLGQPLGEGDNRTVH